MTLADQTADTVPPPSYPRVCRCVMAPPPWSEWVRPHTWTDDEGRRIESKSCPNCGCTLSIVKVGP